MSSDETKVYNIYIIENDVDASWSGLFQCLIGDELPGSLPSGIRNL